MIVITIYQTAEGGVMCEAHDRGYPSDPSSVVTVIGMLEVAKAAMLAGRWGVLDETNGRHHSYDNAMAKHYAEGRERAAASADSAGEKHG